MHVGCKSVETYAGLLTLALFFFPVVVAADTIYLRSGEIIAGKVVGQSRKSVRVTANGRLRTITKQSIRRIKYEPEAVSVQRLEQARRRKAVRAAKSSKEPAKKAAKQQTATRPWSVLWRSLLLPGWGFFHMEENTKGTVYAASFAGLLAGSLAARSAATKSKQAYDQGAGRFPAAILTVAGIGTTDAQAGLFLLNLTEDNRRFDRYQAAVGRFNLAALATLLLYLAQATHAYLVAGVTESADTAADIRLHFSWGPQFAYADEPGYSALAPGAWQSAELRASISLSF